MTGLLPSTGGWLSQSPDSLTNNPRHSRRLGTRWAPRGSVIVEGRRLEAVHDQSPPSPSIRVGINRISTMSWSEMLLCIWWPAPRHRNGGH